MTVAELIARLQTYPPDHRLVFVADIVHSVPVTGVAASTDRADTVELW